MGTLTLDFSDVKDDVVSAGKHRSRIERVTLKPSNSSSFPYLNFQLRIIDGDFAEYALWFKRSLSPKAKGMLVKTLRNLDILKPEETNIEFQVDDESGLVLYPQFTDMVVDAIVEEGTYNNRPTADVKELFGIMTPGEANSVESFS